MIDPNTIEIFNLGDLIDEEQAQKKTRAEAPNEAPRDKADKPNDFAGALDYTTFAEAEEVVAKDWIIKGVMAKGETSSWIAPPGKGKSTLMIDLAVAVSSGQDWRGYRSKRRGA